MWQAFRRSVVIGSLVFGTVSSASESAEANLDYVAARALERAKTPFRSLRADLPKVLRQDNLDYGNILEIGFRRDCGSVT